MAVGEPRQRHGRRCRLRGRLLGERRTERASGEKAGRARCEQKAPIERCGMLHGRLTCLYWGVVGEPANTLLPSASVMRAALAVLDPSFAR